MRNVMCLDLRSNPSPIGTRGHSRPIRRGGVLVLLSLLWLCAPGVDLHAQKGKAKRSSRGPSASRTADPAKLSNEEMTKLRTALQQAGEALKTEPKRTVSLADRVINSLNDVRTKHLLSQEQGLLYEDALLLKAQALFAQKESEDARRALRQILVFNPGFARPVPFSEGAAWMAQMRDSRMGTVEISTVQSGVTVKVGGRVAAVISGGPVKLTLLPGNYEIMLEKEDYLPKPIVFTLDPGAGKQYLDIQLKRGFFSIPFFVSQPDVEVRLADTLKGKSKRFTDVMAKLEPTLRDELLNFLENENINPSEISFLLVNKVPMADMLTFTFQKPCIVAHTLHLPLNEDLRANLNENPIFPLRRSVCVVNLVSTEATMSIRSDLAGAEVFLDGESVGETPAELTVCPGTYKLLVRHDGGKKESKIEVGENEDLEIEVPLRPSLTFLGIYPSEFVSPEIYRDAARVLGTALDKDVAFFNVDAPNSDKLAEYFSENSLNLTHFIAELGKPRPDVEGVGKVVETLTQDLDTNLLLIGYFDLQEPSPTTVTLALFSDRHPYPDITRLDFRSPQDVKIFTSKFQYPERLSNLFYETWFGAKMMDVDFGDAVMPVIMDVQAGSPAKTVGLKPGDVVLKVDDRPLTTTQIVRHLGGKKQDDVARLNVRSLDGSEHVYRVPVTHTPVELSLKSRDILYNVYLTKLLRLTYENTKEPILSLARFNLALIHMRFNDYKSALEILNDITLEGTRGISQGTVLYYRGLCHEKLGDAKSARAAYQEATAFANSTVGSSEGPLVPTLARERLNALK